MAAFLIGFDTASRGAGSRGLGRSGYTHANMTGGLTVVNGPGLSLSWTTGATAFTDFASVADPDRYLVLPDGSSTSRVVTRAFNPALRLAATVADASWRVLSAYCFVGSPGRVSAEVRPPGTTTTGTVLASYTVPTDYQLGWWFRFAFNESIDLVFPLVSGGGPAGVAGVYFDPHPLHFAGTVPRSAFGDFAL